MCAYKNVILMLPEGHGPTAEVEVLSISRSSCASNPDNHGKRLTGNREKKVFIKVLWFFQIV